MNEPEGMDKRLGITKYRVGTTHQNEAARIILI